MKFDELNPEQLEARLAELTEETSEEKRDALDNDALEARIEEMEAIKAELEARKAAAAEEARQCEEAAKMSGKKIIEEEKRMSYEVNTPEYRDAFLRHLMGKELTAEERTAVTAAAAIPTETANKIWGKLELYPILNAIDVMHIPGNVVLPVEGTINNAAVVAMGTAATDSADTLSAVSLGAYKLIKTVEITADVSAMAVPAFEDWLVDRLANKLFRLAATKVAAGTGTNEPTGLATITATSQTYTAAGITYADLLNIISKLPSEYLPNAKFVMSRDTFWKGVKALKTDNDVRVVNTDVGSPAAYNILGFPVILEDEVGTDIIFGDLKEGYVFNFGKDPEVSRDSSVEFRKGSEVFRVMALGDGKPTGVGLVRYTKAT
jgi:HK97 family phage major capsid protein